MSGPNAAFALPPGDRDDVPSPPKQQPSPLDLFDAGREGAAPASDELLPGLTLILNEVGPALDAAQLAFADLKFARKQGQLALMKAAARRLASLTNHVNRTVQVRPRETAPQPTKE